MRSPTRSDRESAVGAVRTWGSALCLLASLLSGGLLLTTCGSEESTDQLGDVSYEGEADCREGRGVEVLERIGAFLKSLLGKLGIAEDKRAHLAISFFGTPRLDINENFDKSVPPDGIPDFYAGETIFLDGGIDSTHVQNWKWTITEPTGNEKTIQDGLPTALYRPKALGRYEVELSAEALDEDIADPEAARATFDVVANPKAGNLGKPDGYPSGSLANIDVAADSNRGIFHVAGLYSYNTAGNTPTHACSLVLKSWNREMNAWSSWETVASVGAGDQGSPGGPCPWRALRLSLKSSGEPYLVVARVVGSDSQRVNKRDDGLGYNYLKYGQIQFEAFYRDQAGWVGVRFSSGLDQGRSPIPKYYTVDLNNLDFDVRIGGHTLSVALASISFPEGPFDVFTYLLLAEADLSQAVPALQYLLVPEPTIRAATKAIDISSADWHGTYRTFKDVRMDSEFLVYNLGRQSLYSDPWMQEVPNNAPARSVLSKMAAAVAGPASGTPFRKIPGDGPLARACGGRYLDVESDIGIYVDRHRDAGCYLLRGDKLGMDRTEFEYLVQGLETEFGYGDEPPILIAFGSRRPEERSVYPRRVQGTSGCFYGYVEVPAAVRNDTDTLLQTLNPVRYAVESSEEVCWGQLAWLQPRAYGEMFYMDLSGKFSLVMIEDNEENTMGHYVLASLDGAREARVAMGAVDDMVFYVTSEGVVRTFGASRAQVDLLRSNRRVSDAIHAELDAGSIVAKANNIANGFHKNELDVLVRFGKAVGYVKEETDAVVTWYLHMGLDGNGQDNGEATFGHLARTNAGLSTCEDLTFKPGPIPAGVREDQLAAIRETMADSLWRFSLIAPPWIDENSCHRVWAEAYKQACTNDVDTNDDGLCTAEELGPSTAMALDDGVLRHKVWEFDGEKRAT